MRQLVYRVHPLPESMKPLVWDFGQLNEVTEQAYARQIILRYVSLSKALIFLLIYCISEKINNYRLYILALINLTALYILYYKLLSRKRPIGFMALEDQ